MTTRGANNGGGDEVDRNSGAPVGESFLPDATTTTTTTTTDSAEANPAVNWREEEGEEEVGGDDRDDREQKKMKEAQEQEKERCASSVGLDRGAHGTTVEDEYMTVKVGGAISGAGKGAAAPSSCHDYRGRKKEKEQEEEKRAGPPPPNRAYGQDNAVTSGTTIDLSGPVGADAGAADADTYADADANRGGMADVRPSLIRLLPTSQTSELSSFGSFLSKSF